MTELKVGSVYFRSYIDPVHWKTYRHRRSPKTGRIKEVLIGWHPNLEQALNSALQFVVSDAEAQSIYEVIDLIKEFKQEVLDAL